MKRNQSILSKPTILLIILFVITSCAKEQLPDHADPIELDKQINHQTENLIIVTLDGFRWQEIFQGADLTLLNNENLTSSDQNWLNEKFGGNTEKNRREKLMPFIWSTIAQNGQIYGNRNLGNKVNVANPYWLSYPGYNEIFTGYVNYSIDSNKFGNSPDHNILEFFNQQSGFKSDKVAAFTHSGIFTRVLNQDRSKYRIVAGAKRSDGALSIYYRDSVDISIKTEIDHLQLYSGVHIKRDIKTYTAAKDYLIKKQPHILYISFLATDKYGHQKKYDSYLKAGYNIDLMLQDLWNYVQNSSQYKDKTTLFITTDHGRGIGNEWYHHSFRVQHSDETWLAVIGPDTSPKGEIHTNKQFHTKQFTKTFASFLGFKVSGVKGMANPIQEVKDQ